MTSLPKVQVRSNPSSMVDLSRDSDLMMCARSLIHTVQPKTTYEYAKMVYSIQCTTLKPMHKHGHTYITPTWRVREAYAYPQTERKTGDPVARITSMLLMYLPPAARECTEVLLSNPALLADSP